MGRDLTLMLSDAREFGSKAHAKHVWHGGASYDKHLESVEAALVKFMGSKTLDPEKDEIEWYFALRAAAWLHDSVEDGVATFEEIEKRFGPTVRVLVWAVTDEPGENRAERKAKTYPKIVQVPYAVPLKLADRISNVEVNAFDLIDSNMLDMYRKEHEGFERALMPYQYGLPGVPEMWQHLNSMLKRPPTRKALKLADKIIASMEVDFIAPQERRRKLARILDDEIDFEKK